MTGTGTLKINRAPVLTLWAAVVAQRLGFDHDEALTLGRAVAGLNVQSKGKRLGIADAPVRCNKVWLCGRGRLSWSPLLV